MSASRRFPLLLVPLGMLVACDRPEIRVYQAPKDPPPMSVAQGEEPGHEGHGHAPGEHPKEESGTATAQQQQPQRETAAARPEIGFETPSGWVVGPSGQLSAATFQIKGEGGEAGVAITPLANFAGREPELVNMWRQQAGAPALSPEEAAKTLSAVEVAGQTGQIFEVTGTRDGKPTRIVTAMLNRPEGTWFFKLSGDDAVVQAQKGTFTGFLKTFRFKEAGGATATAAGGSSMSGASAPAGGSAPMDAPAQGGPVAPAGEAMPVVPAPAAVSAPVKATPAAVTAVPNVSPGPDGVPMTTPTPRGPAAPVPAPQLPAATPRVFEQKPAESSGAVLTEGAAGTPAAPAAGSAAPAGADAPKRGEGSAAAPASRNAGSASSPSAGDASPSVPTPEPSAPAPGNPAPVGAVPPAAPAAEGAQGAETPASPKSETPGEAASSAATGGAPVSPADASAPVPAASSPSPASAD